MQVSILSCNQTACLNRSARDPELQKEILVAGATSDIVVVAFGVLSSDCGTNGTNAIIPLAKGGNCAIVAACGHQAVTVVNNLGKEVLRVADSGFPNAPPDPQNSSTTLSLRGTNKTISVGITIGTARLWDPLVPRSLMLQGAEFIVTLYG